jgi:Domain of unknown function (DUF4129)
VTGRIWMERIGRPMLVALLVTCIALALTSLVSRSIPTWHDEWLAFFCGFAALEAMYSSYLQAGEKPLLPSSARLGAMEILSMAVCRQLWVPLFGGNAPLWAGFPDLRLAGIAVSILSFLPIACAWLVGRRIASTFRFIDAGKQSVKTVMFPAAELGMMVVTGGTLLALTTLLVDGAFPHVTTSFHSFLPISWLVLLYTVLAAIFLAEVQFSALRGQWRSRSLPVAPRVGTDWLTQGSIFLIGAFLFALAAAFTMQAVAARTPLSELRSVFARHGTGTGQQSHTFSGAPLTTDSVPNPVPRPAEHHGDPAIESTTGSWFNISLPTGVVIGGITLLLPWLLLFGGVGYRLRHRRGLQGGVDMSQFLSEFLAGIAGALLAIPRFLLNVRVPRRSPAGTYKESSPAVDPVTHSHRLPRIRLPRPRTERDRVIRAYDRLLLHAKRYGIEGPPGESPREFAAALVSAVPDASGDATELAGRYVEARYSLRVVDRNRAHEVAGAAQRVRRHLRKANLAGHRWRVLP